MVSNPMVLDGRVRGFRVWRGRVVRWAGVLVALASACSPVSAPSVGDDASANADATDADLADAPDAPRVDAAADAFAIDVARGDGAAPDGVGADAMLDATLDAVNDATRDAAVDASGAVCPVGAWCDDFERAALDDGSGRWRVTSPNCSGTGRLALDTGVAHGGARSVRIDGGGGYCDHVFLANDTAVASAGATVFGRVFVRFASAFGEGHVTFLTMRDGADNNRDLRMGGQSRIFMWNRESDDATLPELSPAGIARSTAPTPGVWHCVEFQVERAGALRTWIDGVAVEGLAVDGTSTPDIDARWRSRGAWAPTLTDLKLGWESYAGQTMTVWFDDVAVATSRIGCGR